MKFIDIARSILVILALCLFAANELTAKEGIPVTFNGSIGFESVRVHDYRRTSANTAGRVDGSGSQAIEGSQDKAFLQTYIFRLNPELIVNDHVTVKSELSSGYGRGGYLGDNSNINQGRGFGGRFYGVTPAHSNSLDVNQFYMDIFADIATFKVGRFNKHWGLGAVFNDGSKTGDRFFTLYEGVEANFGLGKFKISPHWANLNSGNSLTRNTEVKDLGLSILYDNPDKDLQLGIYYGTRKSGGNNTLYTNDGTSAAGIGSNTKLIDLFYKKYWGDFSLGIEVPFIDGEAGNVYANNLPTNYKANAYIVEADYSLNEKWRFNLNTGFVSGDSSSNTFEAMYLHPNYQIAELMFRYNLSAVENSGYNVFDSAISNSMYAKLGAQYETGLWTWNFDVIWAKANEVASSNDSRAWQHELGENFTPVADQEDDLGTEFDISFDYRWNPDLVLSAFFSYYLVGDYYSFTNSAAAPLETEDQFATGIKLYLDF